VGAGDALEKKISLNKVDCHLERSVIREMRERAVEGISTLFFIASHPLQLSPQCLHNLSNRFFIPPIPAPLALFGRLDQSRFRENPHVMRNRRLREMDAFLNLPATEAGSFLAT
jgi:hypothetical protein